MITYKILHINGLHFELVDDGGKGREYDVSFVDGSTTIYETKMKKGGWSKLNRKYLSNIAIFIKYQGRTVLQINLLDELIGKRVLLGYHTV